MARRRFRVFARSPAIFLLPRFKPAAVPAMPDRLARIRTMAMRPLFGNAERRSAARPAAPAAAGEPPATKTAQSLNFFTASQFNFDSRGAVRAGAGTGRAVPVISCFRAFCVPVILADFRGFFLLSRKKIFRLFRGLFSRPLPRLLPAPSRDASRISGPGRRRALIAPASLTWRRAASDTPARTATCLQPAASGRGRSWNR